MNESNGNNDSPARKGYGNRIKLALLLLILAGGVVMLALPGMRTMLRHFIEEDLPAYGVYGLVILAVVYIVGTVTFLPGSILTLGMGFLAASIWPGNFPLALAVGVFTVWIASNTGAAIAFLLGRTLARDWIAAKTQGSPKFQALDRAVERQGLKLITLIRLSPIFPFNFLNYALGLTKVRFAHYLIGSLVGMLPGTLMYVYLGAVPGSIAATAADTEAAGAAQLALQIAGGVATVLVVVLVTRAARRALNEEVA